MFEVALRGPKLPWKFAVMIERPPDTPVTRPDELMVATPTTDEDHVTELETFSWVV